MENKTDKLSKGYLVSLLLLMFIIPVASVWFDHSGGVGLMEAVGKWFVFWAVGVRLFLAGLRQATNPLFTLKEIFYIQEPEGQVIVRELGFANVCFGLLGIIALFVPAWRPAAAFAGGLYMGIAGIFHLIKKPVTANEWIAMLSDIYILLIMAAYLWYAVQSAQ